MDYFAVGGRPFLLQFPACIGRIITPGHTQELLAEASGANWAEIERGAVKVESAKATVESTTSPASAGQTQRKPRRRGSDGKAVGAGERLHQDNVSNGGYPLNNVAQAAAPDKRSEPHQVNGTAAVPPQMPAVLLGSAQSNLKVAFKREDWTATKAPLALHTAWNTAEVKPMDPDRFEMLGKVEDAVRNRGKVLMMRDKHLDRLVAVKRMPNEWVRGCHSEFVKAYPGETEFPWQDIGCNRFLNSVGYRYSCPLHGVYRGETHTDVVTDLASEGDLFRWCEVRLHVAPGPEREALVRPLARQIVEGVQQLHDMSIVHRDLSLENILMSKGPTEGDYSIQVIDFGMASTQRYFTRCVRGKASYQAPEVHLEQEYDAFLSDTFSVGVALYALIVKDYPWLSTRPGGCKCYEYIRKHGFRAYLAKRKLRGTMDPVMSSLSESCIRLLEGLLISDPTKRLTLGESTWIQDGVQTRRSVWDEEWLQEGIAGSSA